MPGSTVILDDFKARKIAIKLGIQVTGTLGVYTSKAEGRSFFN
jgi:predicted nucleic acid-binding protein